VCSFVELFWSGVCVCDLFLFDIYESQPDMCRVNRTLTPILTLTLTLTLIVTLTLTLILALTLTRTQTLTLTLINP